MKNTIFESKENHTEYRRSHRVFMKHADINTKQDRHHQHTDCNGQTVCIFHPGPALEVKDYQHAEEPQDIIYIRDINLPFRI